MSRLAVSIEFVVLGGAILASIASSHPPYQSHNHTNGTSVSERHVTFQASEQRYERNIDRAKTWVKERRFDLLIDVMAVCRRRDAVDLLDRYIAVDRNLAAELDKAVVRSPEQRLLGPGFGGGNRSERYKDLTEEKLTIPESAYTFGLLIRSKTCRIDRFTFSGCILFVSDVFDCPIHPRAIYRGDWMYMSVLLNTPFKGAMCSRVLVVCDGDAHFDRAEFSQSLIIANGDIRIDAGGTLSMRESAICATGNIDLPNRMAVGENLFLAGGKITFGIDTPKSERVKPDQKEPPFGVKFTEPKDFGIEVKNVKGGFEIVKVLEWSPFHRDGIREGDVITKVSDAAVTTAPDLRRALRKAVIQESAAVTVRRGNDELTRTVYIDGIPKPPPAKP